MRKDFLIDHMAHCFFFLYKIFQILPYLPLMTWESSKTVRVGPILGDSSAVLSFIFAIHYLHSLFLCQCLFSFTWGWKCYGLLASLLKCKRCVHISRERHLMTTRQLVLKFFHQLRVSHLATPCLSLKYRYTLHTPFSIKPIAFKNEYR